MFLRNSLSIIFLELKRCEAIIIMIERLISKEVVVLRQFGSETLKLVIK